MLTFLYCAFNVGWFDGQVNPVAARNTSPYLGWPREKFIVGAKGVGHRLLLLPKRSAASMATVRAIVESNFVS